MERRDFLALSAASFVAPTASLIPEPHPHTTRRRRRRGRRQTGKVLFIATPENWHPTDWRSIPPSTDNAPLTIVNQSGEQSLVQCRQMAKRHNRHNRGRIVATWAIVAATDGRYLEGGAA